MLQSEDLNLFSKKNLQIVSKTKANKKTKVLFLLLMFADMLNRMQ